MDRGRRQLLGHEEHLEVLGLPFPDAWQLALRPKAADQVSLGVIPYLLGRRFYVDSPLHEVVKEGPEFCR
ncbi:MAG: hypothetical protein L0228_19480 [Planctomycetes bacterium]|nr:hypothetical protein [Planctomycetota bacterium]